MDNRVYYGEYSLQHWIDLILKKNIILPEYQRYFVWDEKMVDKLFETFKKNEFVPPVTIGAFKGSGSGSPQNLILDGQQRLTSILLAYLGLFPDREANKKELERFASDEDQPTEEEELENVIEWTFAKLIEKGKDKTSIYNAVAKGHYKVIDLGVDEEFLKSHFLGFSYLVPSLADTRVQQKYYSSVFRNINIQGIDLQPQESRRSFYFLDTSLADFFNPPFSQTFSVKNQSQTGKLDFVRYISLLSQYKKDGGTAWIARGYKPRMEEYYEQYIYSVVGESNSSMFVDFHTAFPDKDYKPRFQRLTQAVTDIAIPAQFTSIIDMDMYFFGLIYWIIIEDMSLDTTDISGLKAKLEAKISEFRPDTPHSKSPGALMYLKVRIDSSISIYKEHIDD